MKLMEFRSAPPYTNDLREVVIEKYMVTVARTNGGLALKNDAKLRRGIPDRTLIMPNGVVVFVEVKRRGKQLTQQQQREMQRLLNMGQYCAVVDYKTGVLDLIRWCLTLNEVDW